MEEIGMLDHQKIILSNLTGDNEMFLKELKKSIKWLKLDDSRALYEWLKANFWETHQHEIEEVFSIKLAS
jgi:hypothetical protein